MHCGVNEYCCPMARTVTEPSGSTALPRLLSMNSPAMCRVRGSAVSIRACGMMAWWMPAYAAMTTSRAMIAAEIAPQRRSTRAAASAPPCSEACVIGTAIASWHGSARQENQQVEGEPEGDHDRRGDAGEHDGA